MNNQWTIRNIFKFDTIYCEENRNLLLHVYVYGLNALWGCGGKASPR